MASPRALLEEVTLLEKSLLETTSFGARSAHFWYHLHILCDEIFQRHSIAGPGECTHLNGLISQILDCVRLFRSIVDKKSSKNELVDCIIKRSKVLSEFRRLENQLFAIADSSQLLTMTKSSLNGSLMQQFINEVDWCNNKNIMLDMASYIDFSQDFTLKEHVSTILTITNYLNNLPMHHSCTIPVFDIPADLELNSMRYLNTITDAVTSAAAAAIKPVHSNHHTTSIFSSFGESHEALPDEHHSAIYTGYGESYRAVCKGALVAVKKIDPSVFHSGTTGLREAAACAQMNSKRIRSSPFLSCLIGACIDSTGHVYFISPLAPLGSLYDNLTNPALDDTSRTKIDPISKLSILMDVLQGVRHLHSQGFVHGRIKDSNVLLYGGGFRAKLGDFGVQTFFSNKSRHDYKGTRGVRWTPPEILQLEVKIVESTQTNTSISSTVAASFDSGCKSIKTLGEVVSSFPYALTPSIDMYGIGLIIMVLLSEKMPYSNVLYEEGVRGQLLENSLPSISSNYNDYTALCSLEPYMYQCIGRPEDRRPVVELIPVVESLYCDLEYAKQEELLKQRNEEIAVVQKESREISKRLKDHVQLVTKGREMIARKDADKILIHVPKERRERELELEKARAKLRAFEEELSSLQDDLAGAENDVGELFQLRKAIQSRLDFDKSHALQIRQWVDDFDQSILLQRYCTDRDRDRIHALIASAESLEELIIDSSMAGPVETNHHASTPVAWNPFTGGRDMSTEVTPERRKQIESDIRNGVFEYQHLVDNLDTIFRVPLNPNLLQAQQRAITGQQHTGGKAKASSGYVDEDELYEVDYSMSIAAPSTTPAYIQPQQQQNTYRAPPSIQQASFNQTTPSSSYNTSQQQKTATMSSINPLHSALNATSNSTSNKSTTATAAQPTTTFTAVTSDEPDSDEDEDDDDEEYDGDAPQQQTYAHHNTEYNNYEEEEEEYHNIDNDDNQGEQAVHDEDDFPTEERDILHCQYLSASRGDWDEAVGMRRLGLGFSDAQIEKHVENGHTAAHVAATFGHLEIFIELVELGGVEATGADRAGDTPFHCACRRGHLNIVEYLTTKYKVRPDVRNDENITAIQMAATGGFVQLLRYFLEKSPLKSSISPQFKDKICGASLLHWACLNSRSDAVDYLLQTFRLPVESPAEVDDSTCLLWASYGASLQVVQYLIEQANADPKIKSRGGMGCLHMATLCGSVEKTLYLMDTVRLNITEKDSNHQSPFDIATGKCAAFLQERKNKGFVVGSVVEKTRKVKKKHMS